MPTENKLQETKVFTEIPFEKNGEPIPTGSNPIILFDSGDICRIDDDPLPIAIMTHWLKEQTGYFLTREELEKLLSDTFDHAIEWNDLEQSARVQGGYKKNHIENKSQYISSTLSQLP